MGFRTEVMGNLKFLLSRMLMVRIMEYRILPQNSLIIKFFNFPQLLSILKPVLGR